jgi:2-dehydro-3-deoxygluconokinase
MTAVITIGESMVLMVADTGDPLESVTSFSRYIAGAESNVAIGLARLGHQAGWISAIGDDPFGTYLRNTIRGEGVDTSQVVVLPQYPTGLMVKERTDVGDPQVFYYRKGSAASHLSADLLQKEYFANAKILHLTGIFPALSSTTKDTLFTAIKIAKQQGMMISFDPNIRFKLWGADEAKETLLRIAELSDLILPGVKEAEFLLGTQEWEKISGYFHEKGNRYVVMKNGSDGAFYSVQEEQGIKKGYEKGFKVSKVVDTVGAGDGFAVGVLSGILEGLPIHEAVKRGNAIGSLAVCVRGDCDGYPDKKKLEKYLLDANKE